MRGIAFRRGALLKLLIVAGSMVLATSCSQAPTGEAKPSAPPVPAGYLAAAESALGTDSEVILFGDLARNRQMQLLIVNRLPKRPENAVPGLLVSRAAILEKDASDWQEILLADQHLKNRKGFLAGTPLDSVSAWRLQYEQRPDGLILYFTPLQQTAGERPQTIEVRWNLAVRRYQSLDRDFKHFLSEASTLGPMPEFQMNP